MAETLRKTLAELRALAADHRSGAAEIAERAAALLEEFFAQQRRSDPRLPYALSELAETTLRVQPSMAPLLNLANRIQLAAEENARAWGRLRRAVEQFRRQRRQGVARIARLFTRQIPLRARVVTYSYSSTVLAALLAARRRLAQVILSEGRPMYEGRLLAERLAAHGIPTTLTIDAALLEQVPSADAVVVGADTVFAHAYINKVGSRFLQEQARRCRLPFLVLADTAKFLPPTLARFHRIEEKPARELWREAPAGVTIVNRYFEVVPLASHVTLLCERGVLSSAQVRAWLARQPVARRWREAAAKEPA